MNFGDKVCPGLPNCPLSNTIVEIFFDTFWSKKVGDLQQKYWDTSNKHYTDQETYSSLCHPCVPNSMWSRLENLSSHTHSLSILFFSFQSGQGKAARQANINKKILQLREDPRIKIEYPTMNFFDNKFFLLTHLYGVWSLIFQFCILPISIYDNYCPVSSGPRRTWYSLNGFISLFFQSCQRFYCVEHLLVISPLLKCLIFRRTDLWSFPVYRSLREVHSACNTSTWCISSTWSRRTRRRVIFSLWPLIFEVLFLAIIYFSSLTVLRISAVYRTSPTLSNKRSFFTFF